MKPPNKHQLRRSLLKVLPAVGSDRPGMGVFTPALNVITAAHVLPRMPDPEQHALLDHGIEERVTLPCMPFNEPSEAVEFSAISVDPCSDIAVLGLENWVDHPGHERWRQFQRHLTAPGLRLTPFKKNEEFRVSIFTHLGKWLYAEGTVADPAAPTVLVRLRPRSARVVPGTSGSPAFDEEGRCVGIVNKAAEEEPIAQLALFATALPRWVQLVERSHQSNASK